MHIMISLKSIQNNGLIKRFINDNVTAKFICVHRQLYLLMPAPAADYNENTALVRLEENNPCPCLTTKA